VVDTWLLAGQEVVMAVLVEQAMPKPVLEQVIATAYDDIALVAHPPLPVTEQENRQYRGREEIVLLLQL
jgi:hypothetical protein